MRRRAPAKKTPVRLVALPAPTATEREASDREESMVAVCCEDFDSAVGQGFLLSARGRAYLRQGTRIWYIKKCPWCGEDK